MLNPPPPPSARRHRVTLFQRLVVNISLASIHRALHVPKMQSTRTLSCQSERQLLAVVLALLLVSCSLYLGVELQIPAIVQSQG